MPEHHSHQIPHTAVIFPLPDTILFPHTLLPLVIYEPHYRLMLEDCLKGNSMMGVVLMQKGSPKSLLDAPTYRVACLGQIAKVSKLADSSFSVFLGGVARIAITRYTQHRPYPIAEIERLESYPAEPGAANAHRLKILDLFRVLVHTADGAEGDFISRLEELEDAEIVSNLIAATLTIDAHAKQKLLETLDLQERLEMLTRVIEHQIAYKAILQEILAKAPRNIHDN